MLRTNAWTSSRAISINVLIFVWATGPRDVVAVHVVLAHTVPFTGLVRCSWRTEKQRRADRR